MGTLTNDAAGARIANLGRGRRCGPARVQREPAPCGREGALVFHPESAAPPTPPAGRLGSNSASPLLGLRVLQPRRRVSGASCKGTLALWRAAEGCLDSRAALVTERTNEPKCRGFPNGHSHHGRSGVGSCVRRCCCCGLIPFVQLPGHVAGAGAPQGRPPRDHPG